MDLSSAFVKLIFLFNLILLGVGIFIIYQGVQNNSLTLDGERVQDLDELVGNLPKFIIFTGAVISIASFFGCFGAFFESPPFLSWYIFFIMLLIAFQLVLAVYIYHTKGLPQDKVKAFFGGVMKKYQTDSRYMKFVDKAQSWLKCCGAQNANDWILMGMKNPPQSCCKDSKDTCDVDKSYKKNCVDAVNDWVKDFQTDYIWYMGVGIGFQVILIIFTFYARSNIKERQGYVM